MYVEMSAVTQINTIPASLALSFAFRSSRKSLVLRPGFGLCIWVLLDDGLIEIFTICFISGVFVGFPILIPLRSRRGKCIIETYRMIYIHTYDASKCGYWYGHLY